MFSANDVTTLTVVFYDEEDKEIGVIKLPWDMDKDSLPAKTAYVVLKEYHELFEKKKGGYQRKILLSEAIRIYIGKMMVLMKIIEHKPFEISNKIDLSKVDIEETPLLLTTTGSIRYVRKIITHDDKVVATIEELKEVIKEISDSYTTIRENVVKIKNFKK
ncbi:MAG: hypothetical protein PHE54_04730 [Bacilli bacterium]|nr:hypothetical protein [Bacilli bacterium]